MIFFNKQFRDFRLAKRLSLQNIADFAKVSKSSVWAWEKGSRIPTEPNIRALANALKVEVSKISNLKPIAKTKSKFLEESVKNIKKDSSHVKEFITGELMKNINKLHSEFIKSSLIIDALLITINIPFYIKSPTLKYITANKAFLNIIGLDSTLQITDKDDYDLFTNIEAKLNNNEDQQILSKGIPVIERESYIPGTKKKKWGLISKIPIIDNNKTIGLIGVFIDITKRKQLEIQNTFLKNSLTQLDKKTCIISGKYLDKDHKNLQVDFCSDSLFEIAGLKTEDLLTNTRSWEKIIHPNSLDKFNKENQQQWNNSFQSYEFQIINNKTGKPIWVHYQYYESNEQCLVFIVDITSHRDKTKNKL